MIDPAAFSAAALLGGGAVAAWTAYRKTPAEVESISVTTLRGVVQEMREELTRKDRQIRDQNRMIGELERRIQQLEDASH